MTLKTTLAPEGVKYVLSASRLTINLEDPLIVSLFIVNDSKSSKVRRKGFAIDPTSIGSHLIISNYQKVVYRSNPLEAEVSAAFNHEMPIVIPGNSECEIASWNMMEMTFETAEADEFGDHQMHLLKNIIFPGHYTVEWNDGEIIDHLPSLSNKLSVFIS